MPLTLAIIKALLFSVGDQCFALPLLAVSEVALASPNDTIYLDGFESFRLRDRFISVVRPGVVMGFQTPADITTDKNYFIIVVSIGGRRFGIAADSLTVEQELVIKPLESQWVQNDALAGASVLGDGRVVLILDAGSVLRKAIRYERSREFLPVAS
jgi:two-component system chemotaxis sensor kinase CheA